MHELPSPSGPRCASASVIRTRTSAPVAPGAVEDACDSAHRLASASAEPRVRRQLVPLLGPQVGDGIVRPEDERIAPHAAIR